MCVCACVCVCVFVRVFVRVRVCVYLCVSADKQSAAQFATPHRHVDIDHHGNHSPLWQSEMFVEVSSVFLAIFFPECIPKFSATTVVADDVGNNHFGPYKQPYSPRHPNTMHVTEKLYVPIANLAFPCGLPVHASVRSTISWHATTDFSVLTWRTMCQRHSHVKDRLEFTVIQSLLKFS